MAQRPPLTHFNRRKCKPPPILLITPSRSELIRRIVAEWLKDRGLLGKD